MINEKVLHGGVQNFDAIVIGSGMSGGWAAKEFSENGLKTLILERGREVVHLKDYPTMNFFPYDLKYKGKRSQKLIKDNPIVSKCHAFTEDKHMFFVKDSEHPYIQDKPFDWIRGYQTGGRSIMWGRMVQRWSNYDFEGPARDGFAVDWPIRYEDLSKWYSYVERFIGVSGNIDGLDVLPDGEFLSPMEMSAVEKYFKGIVSETYSNRHVIIGRCAHITSNFELFARQNRGGCQFRNLCRRGCPYGGYFSSNSSTLPWALKTGNLTIRNHSIVESIIYDNVNNRAKGVRVVDAKTKEVHEYFAKVIFVNSGSLNTNLILLNSKSNRFPTGLGNDSGLLGKYVAFHNYRASISGEYDGLNEYKTQGRRPTAAYIPRFRNIKKQETNFLRGYASTFSGRRTFITNEESIGDELKSNLMNPSYGSWKISSGMMGETIPKMSNYVILDEYQKDDWGIPILRMSIDYDDNDELMINDFFEQFQMMYEKAGFTNIQIKDNHQAPGLDIHEMGGVRMGRNSKTSLLNRWNQLHSCKNVFVTDGACMTSTGTQNPSLTYMALTARAANFAIEEMKKGNL